MWWECRRVVFFLVFVASRSAWCPLTKRLCDTQRSESVPGCGHEDIGFEVTKLALYAGKVVMSPKLKKSVRRRVVERLLWKVGGWGLRAGSNLRRPVCSGGAYRHGPLRDSNSRPRSPGGRRMGPNGRMQSTRNVVGGTTDRLERATANQKWALLFRQGSTCSRGTCRLRKRDGDTCSAHPRFT